MADKREADTTLREQQPPGGAVKKPAPTAPENLGQEGADSPIKRNTTGQGEPQDRGP
jgi:hypothetical protein